MTASELHELVRELHGTEWWCPALKFVVYPYKETDYNKWTDPNGNDITTDHAVLIWTGWLVEKLTPGDSDHNIEILIEDGGWCVMVGRDRFRGPTLLHALVLAACAKMGEGIEP